MRTCEDPLHLERSRSPEATWTVVEPLLGQAGVTRLADVTWLDDIGLPVFQAIRPNARTLSVSQGKGRTPILAKVAAAMEAVELWYAENVAPGPVHATVDELAPMLGYGLTELRLPSYHCVHPDRKLRWTPARSIRTADRDTLVPTSYLRLDSVVSTRWSLPTFAVSSNGLASGNNLREATVHGLYEVIERDAAARRRWGSQFFLDSDCCGYEPLGILLDGFRTAGVHHRVTAMASPTGVPCYRAGVWSDDFPVEFVGTAAALEPRLALYRALAEAVQGRVAAIAGTREDLVDGIYSNAPAASIVEPANRWTVEARQLPLSSQRATMLQLADRIYAHTGRPPLVVELTPPACEIAIVRTICPGMLCPYDY